MVEVAVGSRPSELCGRGLHKSRAASRLFSLRICLARVLARVWRKLRM